MGRAWAASSGPGRRPRSRGVRRRRSARSTSPGKGVPLDPPLELPARLVDRAREPAPAADMVAQEVVGEVVEPGRELRDELRNIPVRRRPPEVAGDRAAALGLEAEREPAG